MRLVATLVYFTGIALLLYFEKGKKAPKVSPFLWLPVVWMLIAGSRGLTEWFRGSTVQLGDSVATQYMDGSPIDRAFLTLLLFIGLAVLAQRWNRLTKYLGPNWPILVYFLYCAVSSIWSDFPDLAFKRWTKAVGDLVMVLIVVTDPQPAAAVKRFLARAGFILLPCSILCIKYYPEYGRTYDRWTGSMFYSGVATDKNMLGMLCLIFGLASCWRLIEGLRASEGKREWPAILANGVILGVTVWVLTKANSMTSISCLALGTGLIIGASIPAVRRRRYLVHIMSFSALALAFCALFLNLGAVLVKSLGRDPTLTGRTDLWDHLLAMNDSPMLGTGFGSFWLGTRLDKLWAIYWWHPNESHNGYLETYLNLGVIGLILLGIVVMMSYRNIVNMLKTDPPQARLRLAYLVAGLAYNFTEAAVKTMNPMWIALLLAMVAMPKKKRPKTAPALKPTHEVAA